MSRRWFIVVGVVVIVVVALMILISGGRGEPRYQGRALSEWIEDARIADWKSPNGDYHLDPKWQAASNAVDQIGTNALPTLVKWAFAKDSKPMAAFVNRIGSHVNLGRWFRDAAVWQTIAAYGFELLGDKTEAAWPMIVQHTYSQDAKERWQAINWLQSAEMQVRITRSDGKRVIKTNTFLLPTAVRLLKDPDLNVRHSAALILVQEYPKEAEAAGVFSIFPAIKSLDPIDPVTNWSTGK
jgi:hypothetical protein